MSSRAAIPDRATTTHLRQLIASAISCHKSYSVPGICVGYGLAEGTEEEAFRSKFKYVMARLQSLPAAEILRIARAAQAEEASTDLDEALAKFDERGGPQITPLTRQRVLTEIDGVPLSGNLDEIEFLKNLWPIDRMNPPGFSGETTMEDYFIRHRINNFDMSNKDVLDALGIHQCSQKQFFKLLEAMLDPLCREIPEQSDLKTRLNRHLFHDGFTVDEVRRMSGAPVYAVRPLVKLGTTPADDEIGKALLAFSPDEIHGRWQEALSRRSTDPRAAITSARTLLEDTCKWILHEANETFKDDDDLPTLYRGLAKVLKLAPDDHTEQIFKRILGSCQSIVESIGSIRNKLGDAHSQGPLRAKPQPRHAQLAVNLAGTMATFLIATWEARRPDRTS
jgi:AbiJ N-terminal domain 3/Abortive infection C-terminus